MLNPVKALVVNNACLIDKNTFKVPSVAQYYLPVTQLHQLKSLRRELELNPYPYSVLGGGSNIICSDYIAAWVVHLNNKGIEVVEGADKGYQLIRAAAGENWHDLVLFSISLGLGGLENLALIPGSVGAAPIQNIGAYGVEVGEYIKSVSVFDMRTGLLEEWPVTELQLAYRYSRFQSKEWSSSKIIWSVLFRLNKAFVPNLEYPVLKAEFSRCLPESAYAVMKAVVSIRKTKLPDLNEWPNAGSFFKNPIVPYEAVVRLQSEFPEMPTYSIDSQYQKLSAGWMVEYLGFKGTWNSSGTVGCYHSQALVLIARGAKAKDILAFASKIQESVKKTFDVTLEIEPRCFPDPLSYA